jgi:hypothetical protein
MFGNASYIEYFFLFLFIYSKLFLKKQKIMVKVYFLTGFVFNILISIFLSVECSLCHLFSLLILRKDYSTNGYYFDVNFLLQKITKSKKSEYLNFFLNGLI